MKSIIERKIVPEYQTIYKYVSDDGKFMSENQYEVERYEKEQQKPYIEEYKKKLAELHNWVTENESHLYTGKKYSGTLDQMVLYLLLRDNNAKDCYVDTYSSGGDSWKVGDF